MHLISTLAAAEFPMKYKLFKILERFGALHGALTLSLGGRTFLVPADQWHFWQLRDPGLYQRDRIDILAACMRERLEDCHFLDLGADIGAVSRTVFSIAPNVRAITAIEPNPSSFRYLKANLDGLPIPALALNIAVSDFSGLVSLERDATRQSDHAGYVKADTQGSTRVEPIDAFFKPLARDLVVKIDVEGQERAVFLGGQQVLGQARRVVLFMEIHRGVIQRSGISPEQIFAAAEAVRPCEWYLSEPGMPRIDRARPFFDQFPVNQHDVIGVMRE